MLEWARATEALLYDARSDARYAATSGPDAVSMSRLPPSRSATPNAARSRRYAARVRGERPRSTSSHERYSSAPRVSGDSAESGDSGGNDALTAGVPTTPGVHEP